MTLSIMGQNLNRSFGFFSLTAAAAILFLSVLHPLHPQTDRLSGQLKLTGGSVEYVVHYERGRRDWAEYVRSSARNYLVAAERYLSMSYPAKPFFPIYGWQEVHYNGFRVGGTNLGDKIELEYGISEIGKPGLLFHELGHFWFGFTNGYWSPSEEINWLVEGIVSFLPIAMADSGFLRLSESEYSEIRAHWGFVGHRAVSDRPVNQDFRYDVKAEFSGFFYIKTFKVQYLIYRELGPERYRRFLKELLAIGSSRDNEEIIDLLSEVKPADWKGLLGGWVFAGDYRRVAYGDFNDPDCDGLLSVDEIFLSTDPQNVDTDGDSLPDGRERDLGLNPLRADSEQRVRGLTEIHGPFIDGVGDDWKMLPHVSVEEAEGDSSVTGYDLVRLNYSIRNALFNVAVWTKAVPLRAEKVMFDVLVDTDFDRDTDLEFAFSLDNPSHAWLYSHRSNTAVSVAGLKGALNRVFEISIPLSSLGTDRFQFLPIVRDVEKERNHDEWAGWITLDREIMTAVQRYELQSDLWRTDSDGDGMPDGHEIEAGLNPVVGDAPAVVAGYGPFVDGRDTEWAWMNALQARDAAGDSTSDNFDFVRMSYLVHSDSLHILVVTAKPPLARDRVMFDVLVDTNADGKHDLEFAFLLNNPKGPWIYRMDTQKVEYSAELETSMDRVIEVSIPLSVIPSESFRILPIFHDLNSQSNYDELGSWLRIELLAQD